jgi:hypothetical protein
MDANAQSECFAAKLGGQMFSGSKVHKFTGRFNSFGLHFTVRPFPGSQVRGAA